ncbi:MAG: prepilin-type N-terminal cleavage/methylation domain-containing protein [Vulcanimicrobiota bacterium]
MAPRSKTPTVISSLSRPTVGVIATVWRTAIFRSIAINRPHRVKRGFTLSEVMVAIMLISIALLALVSMQAHTLRSEGMTQQRHQASVIAGSYLAQAEASLESDFDRDVSKPRQTADDPDFEVEVNQQPLEPDLQAVTVRVLWREKQGWMDYVVRSKVARSI